MSVFTQLISTIAKIIDFAISLYIFVIIARAILSWIPHDPHHSIVRFIYDITEPVLRKVRSYVPLFGGIDFSPLIIIFALYILKSLLSTFIIN